MEVIWEAIDTASEYLPRLTAGLSKIAQLFKEGKDAEGIKLFDEAIEGMDWFLYVAEAIQKVMGTASTDEDLKQLTEIINELSNAWQNSDFVLISDIIDYDLLQNLERWNGLISAIVEKKFRNGVIQ